MPSKRVLDWSNVGTAHIITTADRESSACRLLRPVRKQQAQRPQRLRPTFARTRRDRTHVRPSKNRHNGRNEPARRAKRDRTIWTVTDDWPEDVLVTEAEIGLFEVWFGDLFDELFGDG